MAIYLNTNQSLQNYKRLLNSKYFVDKSNIIDKINDLIDTSDCYLCITRPRRFGKSSVADMLGAYYSHAIDSKDIFDKLNVSKCESYEENLNKYNVINISFNKIPDKQKTYDEYISLIQDGLISDIKQAYPQLKTERFHTISDMLCLTNESLFLYLMNGIIYLVINSLKKIKMTF